MEPSTASATQPRKAKNPSRRRNSCFGVFKKFGESAWKKVGGSSKEGRASTQIEPPISSLVVDEDRENAPQTFESGIFEVDSREPSEFDFEVATPRYIGNAANRDRMAELYARYGLQPDLEMLKASSTDAPLRVPKASRQRVRVACHVCNTIFKGEKSCSKCGHWKCGDCKRQSITASPPPSDQASLIVVDDDSDHGKDIAVLGEHNLQQHEVERTEALRPVVEKAKYNCHKCSSEFATVANSECENCGHERCNRCSRQTAHISNLDDEAQEGKERDARQKRVYRPAKLRVRRFCESCDEMFPARTNVCAACHHKRCRSCTRRPAKKRKTKAEPAPDPDALRKAEERMAEIEAPIASASTAQEDTSRS